MIKPKLMNKVSLDRIGRHAVVLLILLCVLFVPTQIQAQSQQSQGAVEIVLSVGFSGYKITKFYGTQAKKTLEIGIKVLVDKAIYDELLNEFKEGVLDLNSDKISGSPRWNRAVAKDLLKSELTFQWNMIAFLESKGLDKNNRLLKSQKERLFAEQESFEAGNKDESTFNNMKSLRVAFIRLREKVK